MNETPFETGSALHLVAVAACALLAIVVVLAGRSSVPGASSRRRLRLAVGTGCLAAWIVNTGFWLAPSRFAWESSLPLHFCNLADLVAAVAVLGRSRWAQSLLYFWSFALSSCAFVTPTVGVGPADPAFWVFWTYHAFIPVGVAWVLAVDGFRPGRSDLVGAVVITAGFTAVLMAIDRAFGWNYGFLGSGDPGVGTVLDFLGPFPLRLVWMCLLALLAFILLWLPWELARRRRRI